MGFFSLPKYPIFSETYLSGFSFCKNKAPITFQVAPEGIHLKLLIGFKSKKIFIPKEDITEIGLNQETYRSAGKAATGAIIGGVLTGGIGFIAGAAIGGKRRKENELTLVVNYENESCYLELKPSNSIPKLYQELKKIMPIEEQKETTATTSAADELMKFATLRDQGILTDEEFETKKRQLLGL